eukprot:TRINITY_DN14137_c0_g1_i1.p1 TRINITY_DN14137_c0_g1~~TRINITY_DN14137_c0_g1_i1.p1  ORF type:complete len:136 (+),score=28.26 TRINITY_DN14137_c0_g1_i1:326-733(+)
MARSKKPILVCLEVPDARYISGIPYCASKSLPDLVAGDEEDQLKAEALGFNLWAPDRAVELQRVCDMYRHSLARQMLWNRQECGETFDVTFQKVTTHDEYEAGERALQVGGVSAAMIEHIENLSVKAPPKQVLPH